MLEPGRWALASVMAERVAAIRLLQLADTFVLHDRVLADAHFEFRGGSPRRDGGASGRDEAVSGPLPVEHQRSSEADVPT